MKCIVCNGEDIQKKQVDEEIRIDNDVVLVPIETLVCLSCGERYYDRRTMRHLEETADRIRSGEAELAKIGQVLRASE